MTFRDTSADQTLNGSMLPPGDNDPKGDFAYRARLEDENAALKAEVAHWKANHKNMVSRSRVLIDRPDLPLERVQAFHQIKRLQAEVAALRAFVASKYGDDVQV